MTLLAEPRQVVAKSPADEREELAQQVMRIVALAGGSIDPNLIDAAALVLARRGLIDCPGVTFGCNYDLTIRSNELRDGYARAVSGNRLLPQRGQIRLRDDLLAPSLAAVSDIDEQAVQDVFALSREELERQGRLLLLGE